MAHNVLLEETFRGPMDLLLHLVKRDEIDIHDIPISHLTREYMAELDRLQELDIDLASEFLIMASMLMEIKSRMLLPPVEEIEGDEDEEDFDPRRGLVQALLEYKRFKEAAAQLGELAENHANRFARIAPRFEYAEEEEEQNIEDASAVDLLVAFQGMIRSMLSKEAVEIVSDEVPTEVRIDQIVETIEAIGETRFSKLLSSEPTKGEMVGFFIALLELIRQLKVKAWQTADFTDILIAKRDVNKEYEGLSERELDGMRLASAYGKCKSMRVMFAYGKAKPIIAAGYVVPPFPASRRRKMPTDASCRIDSLFKKMPLVIRPVDKNAEVNRHIYNPTGQIGSESSISFNINLKREAEGVTVENRRSEFVTYENKISVDRNFLRSRLNAGMRDAFLVVSGKKQISFDAGMGQSFPAPRRKGKELVAAKRLDTLFPVMKNRFVVPSKMEEQKEKRAAHLGKMESSGTDGSVGNALMVESGGNPAVDLAKMQSGLTSEIAFTVEPKIGEQDKSGMGQAFLVAYAAQKKKKPAVKPVSLFPSPKATPVIQTFKPIKPMRFL